MSAAPPPSPAQPPGPPHAGGVPMGTSPTSQPVPNAGSDVMVKQGIALIIKLMGELLPKASGSPEAVEALATSIQKLNKFAAGRQNPAAEQEQMKALMQRQQQMSQLPQQPKPQGA